MARHRFPLLPKSLRWLGVASIIAVIVYFSLVTAPPKPSGSTPFWDKRLHFLAYAGLALALAYATARERDRPYRRAALVIGGAVGLGILVEFTQGRLPHRDFELADMLANTLGALLASLWFVVERRLRYVRARRLVEDSRIDSSG